MLLIQGFSLFFLSKQVHDFGFFRYDPGAIKFLKYDEIPLDPEAASVGLEIRVVGNDSGEKVSTRRYLVHSLCSVAAMNSSVCELQC